MNSTRLPDGTLTYDRHKILAEQLNYYSKLYTSDSSIKFQNQTEPAYKLSEDLKVETAAPLTLDKISIALKTMENRKTLGDDSVPTQIFKLFWSLLKDPLYQAYLEACKNKVLHYSAWLGMLALIPKPHRDLSLIRHCHPISLLKMEYKG